jgi:16S rRNA (guanine1516-N2)-methyltransferase
MQLPKKTLNNNFFSPVGVYPDGAEFIDCAKKLAKQINLPLLTQKKRKAAVMVYGKDGISLHHEQGGEIRVDFSTGKWSYRLARIHQEQLVKAMGKIKAGDRQKTLIIDGTGGLGRDSFILAGAGFPVITFERNPIIAALLSDGLKRALANPAIRQSAKRIQLITKDALSAITETVNPDIIYLDPMFVREKAKALVKKELQMIQQLVDKDIDSNKRDLFAMAIKTASKRVVVKRAKTSPWLIGHPPSYSTTGSKAIRFDIYLTGNDDGLVKRSNMR